MKHNKIKKILAKESAKWHPQGPWRLPSCAYTLEHKLAFLECERSIMGENTFAGYLHDCDKLFFVFNPVAQRGRGAKNSSQAPTAPRV